jgi:hypothetical protein
VGAETSAAERRHDFESLLREHGRSAVRRFISEGVGLAARDWVGLNKAAAFLFDCLQRGVQCSSSNTASAMALQNNEAGNPPDFGFGFGSQLAIPAAARDAREFFGATILAPTDRLAVFVDQDAVGATGIDEGFFLPAIPCAPFHAGMEMLRPGQSARTMKVHAPAVVPAVSLGKQRYEIRPSLL